MISKITFLALDKINISSIQISILQNFCSPYFFGVEAYYYKQSNSRVREVLTSKNRRINQRWI